MDVAGSVYIGGGDKGKERKAASKRKQHSVFVFHWKRGKYRQRKERKKREQEKSPVSTFLCSEKEAEDKIEWNGKNCDRTYHKIASMNSRHIKK